MIKRDGYMPGVPCWIDTSQPDPAAAAEFYGALFGWEVAEIPGAAGYRTIANGGRSNGGIFPMDDRQAAWLPYFGHEDVDRLLGDIDRLGGRVLSGPMEMPAGRIAVLSDPQGAAFAVWTGDYDD